MKSKWTSAQEKAINSEGGTVLVSAAAGSGKTSVLVQRVINKIISKENPVDIDKLLIVTFTNAAAQEMKNRISESITSLLTKYPHDTNLHRQQMLLKCADIGTIHSFCNTLIKDNFHKLEISPNFKIATETEVAVLKEKAIENTFDYFYDTQPDAIKEIMDVFNSEKSNEKLIEIIDSVSTFINSIAFPQEWLKDKLKFYEEKSIGSNNTWVKIILDYAADMLKFVISLIEDIIASLDKKEELKEKYLPSFISDLDCLKRLVEELYTSEWDVIAKNIREFSFSRLKPCKSKDKESINLKRDYAKSIMASLKKYFEFDSNDIVSSLDETSKFVKILFDITFYYRNELKRLKLSKNMVDFNDLERFALNLLVDSTEPLIKSDIAQELSEKYTEIMIDEYQDINEIQDTIFKLISKNETNLFIVGDVKQSIYKFRQSRPEIFLSKKNSYTPYDSKTFPAKIILDKNFRSRDCIIDSINSIFECLMSKKVGDMEYGDEERLYCKAEYISSNENDVSLKFIETPNIEEDEDILEAREIANTINDMILNKYQIKQGESYRDVQYKDFCILLRSFNSHAVKYLHELTAMGIPCWSETNEKFLSTYEISTMISLLKIIDNPIDDIPLISVMISPLFDFTIDELSIVRMIDKDVPFYFALKEYAKESLKAKLFVEKINYFRNISETMSCSELIDYIYNETEFPYICLALPNGELKKENLLLLKDYAKKYDEESYKGLSGFLSFIKSIERRNSDLPSAFVSSETENTVRIMSIHKSKGLEFPVCILAGCSRKFVKDNETIIIHPDYGIGMKLKSNDGLVQYNNFIFQAINLQNRNESISEEMRIFYVALTRAKQKLIIVASLKNKKKIIDKCMIIQSFKNVFPQLVQNSDSFLEWILVCLCFSSSKEKLFELLGISDKFLIPKNIKQLNWSICLSSKLQSTNFLKADKEDESKVFQVDKELLENIRNYAEFEYPFKSLENLPLKISASKISHSGEWENYFAASWPVFMSSQNISPTARGTAMHKFMCYSDLKRAYIDLESEIDRLSLNGLLTSQEVSLLNKFSLKKFMNSKLCRRILESKEVLKEYKFSVRMPAKELPCFENKSDCSENFIIVQGAMDCAFLENGNYIIVDYKTDRIENIKELYSKYLTQLQIYKYALEKTKGIPVREIGIYSFFLSDYCF